mmetsp:Transcript_75215/g.132968  ORF Transcript_75215/g.132968 Transcript_75215/m.132968 type:complete len:403 (-) Transcript_75215:117-1325(-)
MSFQDDFDYPTAQRCHTMSLQSIERGGACIKKATRGNPAALRVDDIPGAQAGTTRGSRQARMLNRPDLHSTTDIFGTSSNKLIPDVVSRPNWNHSCHDIPGARGRNRDFKSDRQTDPLNPHYKLPSFHEVPAPAPPHRNESNRVDDIPGTRPRAVLSIKSAARDTFNVDDIAGAKADSTASAKLMKNGRQEEDWKSNPSILFNKPDVFATNRCVNPLSPRYRIGMPKNVDPEEWEGIGGIPGNHPRPMPKAKPKEEALYSLRTDDVKGAQPSSCIPAEGSRRQIRNPVDISDIESAHPTAQHTAFHYKSTQRHLDPMNPDYPELKWKTTTHPGSQKVGAAGVSQANNSVLDAHMQPSPPRPTRVSPDLVSTSSGQTGASASRGYQNKAPPGISLPKGLSLPA